MSGSHPNPRSSEQQNSYLTLPLSDFTTLAHKLQEASQALLEFGTTREVAARDPAEAESAPPEFAPKAASKPASGQPSEQAELAYEVRTYRLPRYILRDERKLLEMTDADELSDVLHKAYGHLNCIAVLMKNYNPEENLCGFELNDIAEALELPLGWLDSLFSTLCGYELIHQVKAE